MKKMSLNYFVSFLICMGLLLLAVFVFLLPEMDKDVNKTEQMLCLPNGAGQGNALFVPTKPQRVVILNSSSFDMWMRLGGKDKIVGVSVFSSVDKELYKDLPESTLVLPNYNALSPEKLIALNPDLIIMNGMEGVRNNLVETMKKSGIPFMNLPGNCVQDTFEEIRIFGKLLGNEDRAEQEIARLQQSLNSIQEKHIGKPRKKVMMILGISTSFFMVTPHARQSEILYLAGGDNIVKEKNQLNSRYLAMSLEYAAKENPDYVFFINHGPREKMEVKVREALAASSAWNAINAVREGRVYVLPSELFSINPGLQTDKAVEFLSKIIYEEQ